MTRAITVLGAGIVGTCCALALQRDGFDVTLVDRSDPGSGASSGNAGMIQTSTPLPMATPGILKAVPGMLLDPKGALVVRWRHLPRLLPWLLRFWRESEPGRVEQNASALSALLNPTAEAYKEILRAAKADEMMRYRGMLFAYRGAEEAAGAQWEMDLFRRHGAKVETLGEDDIRQMEPALNRAYDHAFYLPDTFFTVDPRRLVERLAHGFVQAGGTLVRKEVLDIEIGSDGPTALVTADGRAPVQGLVLAAGAFSAPWAKKLGVRVPLETARGYHLMLPDPGVRLGGPVIDGKRHYAAIPMAEGIRIAGMLELASLTAPPRDDRADILLPLARELLPSLDGKDAVRWMGHRPAMPDSLPVIERSTTYPTVYFAFGHGQLGLTMGAITGLLIADLAAGRAPRVDLSPYRSDRF